MLAALCGWSARCAFRPGGRIRCLRRILAAAVRPRRSWRGAPRLAGETRTGTGRAGPAGVFPSDGEAVGIAQVDIGDLVELVADGAQHRALQQPELAARILAAQAQLDAGDGGQGPGAARVELQAVGGEGAAGQGL